VTEDPVRRIADAVLYEGYVLYPYRASAAKNRVRFQFGVVAPRDYVELGGSESWQMQTECLVEPIEASEPGGPQPGPRLDLRFDLKVRFLQLQARAVEEAVAPDAGTEAAFRPVEFLELGGEPPGGGLVMSWDEGVERELEVDGIELAELAAGRKIPLEIPAGSEIEELRGLDGELRGRLVRRRWAISALVRVSAETVSPGGSPTEETAEVSGPALLRLRVRIENRTPWPPGMGDMGLERDEALRRSLLSAHTLLRVSGGSFVSLLDPPAAAATAAAACANLHTWPVLVGAEGSRDLVLSSPIILYDYPALAPESPGELCDSTEIDEILTLRIMTLTEEEKRQARGTDERARRIVERADAIPAEVFERLHGAVRSLRGGSDPPFAPPPEEPAGSAGSAGPGGRPIPAIPDELASWEEFLNPPGETPPEEASLTIGSTVVGRGSRVRLRPSRRADSMDLFLAGRVARVTGVYRDVEDESYVAVTLTDGSADGFPEDGGDLSSGPGRFFYFFPDEIEPLMDERMDERGE